VLPVAVRHRVASFVLATLVPLALDGCVSVGLSRAPAAAGDAGTGEVAVSVYRKSAERKAGATVSFPVLSELERLDGASWTTVARSMAGSFTLPRVPPGRYALRVARKIDEHGDVVPLRQPASKEFEVRAGERVEASVLLEKVPVGWIVLAAVTVVLLVVLAVELAVAAQVAEGRIRQAEGRLDAVGGVQRQGHARTLEHVDHAEDAHRVAPLDLVVNPGHQRVGGRVGPGGAHGFGVAAGGPDVVEDPLIMPGLLLDVVAQVGLQPAEARRQAATGGHQQWHRMAHVLERLAEEGQVAGQADYPRQRIVDRTGREQEVALVPRGFHEPFMQ